MVNTESYNKATERFIDAGGFIRTNHSLVQATTLYVPVLNNQLDSFNNVLEKQVDMSSWS